MMHDECKERTCAAMKPSHANQAFANRCLMVFASAAICTSAFNAQMTATSLALLTLVLVPLDESVKKVAITFVAQDADGKTVMCLCGASGVLLTLPIVPAVSQLETILGSASTSLGVTL